METPKAIPQPSTIPAPVTGPQAAENSPPWLEADAVPLAVSSAPASRRTSSPAQPLQTAEAVHWSIVVLTLATAASVLLGSYGGKVSRPKELLPVMIVTTAR
jgi:hypothetical protein